MTEAELLEHVRTEAAALGLLAIHRGDSRRDYAWSPGFPDLVIASPAGRGVIFAELKTRGGQLSRGQQKWRRALQSSDAIYLVWRPADWASGEIQARLRFLAQP